MESSKSSLEPLARCALAADLLVGTSRSQELLEATGKQGFDPLPSYKSTKLAQLALSRKRAAHDVPICTFIADGVPTRID